MECVISKHESLLSSILNVCQGDLKFTSMQLHQLSDKIGGTIRLKPKHNPPPSPVQCCETKIAHFSWSDFVFHYVVETLPANKTTLKQGSYIHEESSQSPSIRSFLIISISSVGPIHWNRPFNGLYIYIYILICAIIYTELTFPSIQYNTIQFI
jgi:hypothetical protein